MQLWPQKSKSLLPEVILSEGFGGILRRYSNIHVFILISVTASSKKTPSHTGHVTQLGFPEQETGTFHCKIRTVHQCKAKALSGSVSNLIPTRCSLAPSKEHLPDFLTVVEECNRPRPVVLLRMPSLVPEPSLSAEPLVQFTQLPQEAVVGPDLSLLANRGQGSVDVHVSAEHQVGDDQRRGAAVAFPAVNVNLTYGNKEKNS